MSESISIKAHFDGKTIVPDEPVNLQANESIIIDIHRQHTGDKKLLEKSPEEQRVALMKLLDFMKDFPEVPLEATRRVNMYDDERY